MPIISYGEMYLSLKTPYKSPYGEAKKKKCKVYSQGVENISELRIELRDGLKNRFHEPVISQAGLRTLAPSDDSDDEGQTFPFPIFHDAQPMQATLYSVFVLQRFDASSQLLTIL